MSANRDPQRRPVWIDRVNNRFLADPVGAGPWPVVTLDLGMLGSAPANTLVGRYGSSGPLQALSADVTIDLINTATSGVIAAARLAAGSTTGAGVLRLTDSTSSTSTTTAATPSAVKSAYDLASAASSAASGAQATASAALPKSGGTMTGAIAFAAGQTISGYGLLNGTQSWTKGQRGAVVSLTCAASVAPDFAAGNHFSCVLDQAMTLAAPTNVVAGQSGVIELVQPVSGSTYSVSYASAWKFIGGAPSVASGNSAISALAYYVRSATEILCELRAGY